MNWKYRCRQEKLSKKTINKKRDQIKAYKQSMILIEKNEGY